MKAEFVIRNRLPSNTPDAEIKLAPSVEGNKEGALAARVRAYVTLDDGSIFLRLIGSPAEMRDVAARIISMAQEAEAMLAEEQAAMRAK